MDAIIHFSRRFLRIRAKINEDKAEICQIGFIFITIGIVREWLQILISQKPFDVEG